MNVYVELLLICVIIVYILDISGFGYDAKTFISKILTKGKINTANYSFKPFLCSRCMTFWLGLIWIIVTKEFSLITLSFCFLLSWLTFVIKDLMILIEDLWTKIINR